MESARPRLRGVRAHRETQTGYERVTDPEAIARVIARPEGRGRDHWFIEVRAPDAVLAKEINNRLMGVPTQVHAVAAATSLAELLAGICRPRSRGFRGVRVPIRPTLRTVGVAVP